MYVAALTGSFSLARMHSAVVTPEPGAGLADEAVPRDKIILVTVVISIPVATERSGSNRPGCSDRPRSDSRGCSGRREDAGITCIARTVPAVPIVGPPVRIRVARAFVLAVGVWVELCAVAWIIDDLLRRSGS